MSAMNLGGDLAVHVLAPRAIPSDSRKKRGLRSPAISRVIDSSCLASLFVFPVEYAELSSVLPSCLYLFCPCHPYLFLLCSKSKPSKAGAHDGRGGLPPTGRTLNLKRLARRSRQACRIIAQMGQSVQRHTGEPIRKGRTTTLHPEIEVTPCPRQIESDLPPEDRSILSAINKASLARRQDNITGQMMASKLPGQKLLAPL
jgi:hypothetical protein